MTSSLSSEDTLLNETMRVEISGEYLYLLKDRRDRYWLAVPDVIANEEGGEMPHERGTQLTVIDLIPGGVQLDLRPSIAKHLPLRAYELRETKLARLLLTEK